MASERCKCGAEPVPTEGEPGVRKWNCGTVHMDGDPAPMWTYECVTRQLAQAKAAAGAMRKALATAKLQHTHNCYRRDEAGNVVLRDECHPACWERKRKAALASHRPAPADAERADPAAGGEEPEGDPGGEAPMTATEAVALNGVSLIAAERHRQIESEGFTPDHDDEHEYADLAVVAASLAVDGTDAIVVDELERGTPGITVDDRDYDGDPWGLIAKHGLHGEKPDRIRELTIAGALIAAEIDRLKRRGPVERGEVGGVGE